MAHDLLKGGKEQGRFSRGNLHCHSNRSDGLVDPEDVAAAYREAGYDFICLSDHYEAEYGWRGDGYAPPALGALHHDRRGGAQFGAVDGA
jgi:hypothetical protein